MPTMETFSPVRPSVRRGTGWSAAPDDCGCSEAAKLTAADFFRKSLRSMEASEKYWMLFRSRGYGFRKVCNCCQLCMPSQPEYEKFILGLVVRSIRLAPQPRFLPVPVRHRAVAAR